MIIVDGRYTEVTAVNIPNSYSSLIKWHYRLFREVEGSSRPLAALQTANNLFWGVIKKLFYVKKSNN